MDYLIFHWAANIQFSGRVSTLTILGIVIYLLLNKLLCLSYLHSEVILYVGALILVELSQDSFIKVLRDFQ
jgi:hypothetical protein